MANRVVELISPDLASFSQLAFAGKESALPIYLHLDASQHEVYGGYTTTQGHQHSGHGAWVSAVAVA